MFQQFPLENLNVLNKICKYLISFMSPTIIKHQHLLLNLLNIDFPAQAITLLQYFTYLFITNNFAYKFY